MCMSVRACVCVRALVHAAVQQLVPRLDAEGLSWERKGEEPQWYVDWCQWGARLCPHATHSPLSVCRTVERCPEVLGVCACPR